MTGRRLIHDLECSQPQPSLGGLLADQASEPCLEREDVPPDGVSALDDLEQRPRLGIAMGQIEEHVRRRLQ